MQIFLAVLTVAGLASAQSLAGLPSCATSCVGNSIPTECNLEPSCICSSTAFIEAISCCVSTACNEADQVATLEYARDICAPAGVTNLPTAAGCASNSTSATTSGSSSPSATGTGSVAQSASSAVSSLSSSASEAEASATSAVDSATSAASEAAASATEDAAGRITVQGLGALGAGVLGLAALF